MYISAMNFSVKFRCPLNSKLVVICHQLDIRHFGPTSAFTWKMLSVDDFSLVKDAHSTMQWHQMNMAIGATEMHPADMHWCQGTYLEGVVTGRWVHRQTCTLHNSRSWTDESLWRLTEKTFGINFWEIFIKSCLNNSNCISNIWKQPMSLNVNK